MLINDSIQKQQIQKDLPSENPLLINICFIFTENEGENKSEGYCVYYKMEDPEELENECIVVYYKKSLKTCVIVIATSKSFIPWKVVTDHMYYTTIILPFHKDCTLCGRCAENLTICNCCKVT